MLTTLTTLCSIPSVTHNMEAIADVMTEIKTFFSETDAIVTEEIHNSSHNLIIANHTDLWSDVVLNWHIDVVPPSTDGQFSPFVQDDKLYARWSGDMKGGVTMMMHVFRDLLLSWKPLPKIALIITSDEEVWGFDGAEYLTDVWYGGDVVLVPDSGSSTDIVITEKWWIRIGIEALAPGCHSARPWLSKNPIDQIYDLYHLLKKKHEHSHIFEKNASDEENNHRGNSVSLTMLNAWVSGWSIPPKATGIIDMRFIEWYDIHDIHSETLEIIAQHKLNITSQFVIDLLHSDPDHTAVQAYLASAKKYIWPNVRLTREHGASDGRWFSRKGSVVILQRPTCENIHALWECVSLSSMDEIYHVMTDFLLTYFLLTYKQKR